MNDSSQFASLLGAAGDGRVLIVTADELGVAHSANRGVYRALREGFASSASLMVPCPWARHAASEYRGEDVGVHLTLNAPEALYRWGPITVAPSLLDGTGGFPRSMDDLWEHADVDEVRREARSQLERAILWGFDVTHLSSLAHAMVVRPELFDVLLDLAVDYRLPIRVPSGRLEQATGFPFRALAAEAGVLTVATTFSVPEGGGLREVIDMVAALEPGLHELVVRPAEPSGELSAGFADANHRSSDLAVALAADRQRCAESIPATVIGWRAVRDAQRAGRTLTR